MNMKPRSIRILLSLTMAIGTAGAQTIIVNTANDVIDFGGAQQVADLPGPDGRISLAEAALASDNTPGVQTIGFHVPQSEWTDQLVYPGRAVLHPFAGFILYDTVILDATTQTAFTGETNPNGGGEVVISNGIHSIGNVGSVVRGFDSTAINFSGGSANVIQGNTQCGVDIWDSSGTLVGGTNPGQGNTVGFITISSSSNVVVVGNRALSVRLVGGGPYFPPALNNRIGGPTLAERNYVTGTGSYSNQGFPGGVAIEIYQAGGTIIENNWIGTTPDGLAQGHPATTIGVGLWLDNQGTVIRNNRIAGIHALAVPPHGPSYYIGTAIAINGTGNGLTIVGNKIGLNANDQPLLGSVTGISTINYYLGPVQNVVIGGTAPGEGNEIAGHDHAGIEVANTYSGVRIARNSIHDNGGLGIDLITDGFQTGVTPNDPLDPDTGGNGLQNFPVLQSATIAGATLRVVGTLNSTPAASFSVEFFASPQGDPSGYGEGRNFLFATTVLTDGSGNAAFDVTLPALVQQGWVVTATATAAAGSTSEFSAWIAASGSPLQWADLGHGLPGTNGVPVLTGSGTLTAGSTVTWAMTGARPSSLAWFVIGFHRANLPIAGGILVPAADGVIPAAGNGLGAATVLAHLVYALPPGLEVSVQACVLDPVGPFGFAATNAIAAAAQ